MMWSAKQQKLVAAGFVAPNEGWLYVGRVSEDKTTWVDGPKNVRELPPQSHPANLGHHYERHSASRS